VEALAVAELQLQQEVQALAVADMAQQQRAAELAHTKLAVQQELQVRVLDAKAALRAVRVRTGATRRVECRGCCCLIMNHATIRALKELVAQSLLSLLCGSDVL
jgi:hypothetical protein